MKQIFLHASLALLLALQSGTALASTPLPANTAIDFDREGPAPGNMRFQWIHGSISAKANTDVRVQVHRYNAHTYILRQNPAIHWEAPFMYLVFGNDSAVLIDTGATAEAEYFPLRHTVDTVIQGWLDENNKADIKLFVLPSGADFSQLQGMAQFNGRPNTSIVEPTPEARQNYLALAAGNPATGKLDLGGRVLQVMTTPGVSKQAISLYDPWSDLLFTGNSFYPGRLVIRDFSAYKDSLQRLLSLADANPVSMVLGGRIEMSDFPGEDYRLRANYRPNEHSLALYTESLATCYNIVHLINGREDIRIYDDFIVMHGVGRGARDHGWPSYSPARFAQARRR